MFEAPYVLAGVLADAVAALPNDAWRVHLHLLLDITVDRAHPYWAVRPFSITHLRKLWPGPATGPSDQVRSLRAAVENELAARSLQRSPDIAPYATPHDHFKPTSRIGGCAICGPILASNLPVAVETDLRDALNANDVAQVSALTPLHVSELLADGWTLGVLHRSTLAWLNTYRESAASGLRLPFGDVEQHTQPEAQAGMLFRRLIFDHPSVFSGRTSATTVDGVRFIGTSDDAFLHLADVSAQPLELARGSYRLDIAGQVWSSYVRLTLPGRLITLGDTLHVRLDHIKTVRRAEHRRFWSTDVADSNLVQLIAARQRFTEEDRARLDAAVGWAGLAVTLWPEDTTRALALMWMALEALYGTPASAFETASRSYAHEVSSELARDLLRHAIRRSRGTRRPTWLPQLISLHSDREALLEFAQRIHTAAQSDAREQVLVDRSYDVLRSATVDGQREYDTRTRRDLHFVSAVRNGMAHRGSFSLGMGAAQYLMNVVMSIFGHATRRVIDGAAVSDQAMSLEELLRGNDDIR